MLSLISNLLYQTGLFFITLLWMWAKLSRTDFLQLDYDLLKSIFLSIFLNISYYSHLDMKFNTFKPTYTYINIHRLMCVLCGKLCRSMCFNVHYSCASRPLDALPCVEHSRFIQNHTQTTMVIFCGCKKVFHKHLNHYILRQVYLEHFD